ncbi:hypothetical protein VNO78_33316 [Psophocarpus tetragonolobus]|uniref:Uncharacterized protein n=1 Tax=Psophocarpus tetragonolobus TaxID=3891 RepID=A0AAN9P0X3_PSOTE
MFLFVGFGGTVKKRGLYEREKNVLKRTEERGHVGQECHVAESRGEKFLQQRIATCVITETESACRVLPNGVFKSILYFGLIIMILLRSANVNVALFCAFHDIFLRRAMHREKTLKKEVLNFKMLVTCYYYMSALCINRYMYGTDIFHATGI